MLKIEGKIVGAWTTELKRVWDSLSPCLCGKKLFIDLCGVNYIDPEGRKVLAEIYRRTRARFHTNTPLTEYFAQQASSSLENGHG